MIEISREDYKQIKKINAKNYYKQHLQGKDIYNPILGKILFTQLGLGETFHRTKRNLRPFICLLKSLVETGECDGILEPLYKPRKDRIIGFYHIKNIVKLSFIQLELNILIAEDQDGKKYYMFKKDPQGDLGEDFSSQRGPSGPNNIIIENEENFKSELKYFQEGEYWIGDTVKIIITYNKNEDLLESWNGEFYHYSKKNFGNFDKKELGKNLSDFTYGYGFYFWMGEPPVSNLYGKYLYKVDLNFNNLLHWNSELNKKFNIPQSFFKMNSEDKKAYMKQRGLEITKWAKEQGYDAITNGKQIVVFDEDQITVNDIVKESNINERLEKINDDLSPIFITNSSYDIYNLIMNKAKDYRIVWDSNIGFYIIADANDYIHGELMEAAMKQGFYYNLGIDTESKVTDYYIDELDQHNVACFTFNINDNNLIDDDRSSDQYVYKYIYNFGVFYTRDNLPLEDIPLYQNLGEYKEKLRLEELNEKLEEIDRTTVVINREDELINYLKSKQKSQRIIYDSKKDWYLVSSNEMLTHDNIVLQAYNMGYYGEIPITNYIKEGMNRVKGNIQDPIYLYSFYYSPQETLYKNFFDGIDHGYVFKNFGSIYTKGFEIEKILDLGVPVEMKENINSIYNKINQMYEKLTSFKIVPRKEILFDDMEDETGINVIEDNLEECMSSAQLGTAPTPTVDIVQAKVNGTPVEGKSVKKKKKVKDIVEELNNIIKPWEDDAASPKYVFRNAVDPEIEFEDALDLIIYGQDEDEKEEYQEYLNFFKDTGRLNDYLSYCKEKGYDRVDVSIESFGLREDIQELSPEDIMDMIEETFDPNDILTTTIKNNRDIIRVSVYYTHSEDTVLTHSIKLEYLDIDEETVIDEVIEEDLSVGDCLEELQYIFKTHKPLTEDQNTDQVVIEWLDKLHFISTNARTGFNYYYEGNYTHVITYDRSKIRYMIISDNKPIYDKSWNINSFEDVNTAFKEIEKELDSHE